jgi:SWI/SNF-related matrix-associated actin-dependent regulator 1 of chromatin subfamily A
MYDSLVPPQIETASKADAATGKAITINLAWTANKYGQQIAVSFPYDPKVVNAVRALEKRWWDGTNKAWLVPDDLESFDKAVAALEDFGLTINIPEAMSAHYASERDRRGQALQASRASTSDIDVPTKLPLLPFQKAGVAFIELHNGRALVADPMGLGKSAQAIGWLIRHPEALPALIIVPATLRISWVREIAKFSDLIATIIASASTLKSIQKLGANAAIAPQTADITIINYDILAANLEILTNHGFKTLILDEVQAIKEPTSKRTKAALALAKTIPNVIELTGTPLMNRPKELFTLVQAVNPKIFPNFWKYAKEFCGAKHNGFGWDFSGASNLETLDHILRERVMVRREKTEVLKELPEKRRITLPLTINGRLDEYRQDATAISERIRMASEQRKEWRRRLSAMTGNERKTYLADHAEESASAGRLTGMILSEIAELRMKAAMAKMDAAVEQIVDMQESNGKLLVFAHHHIVIDTLTRRLVEAGLKVVKVDGRENAFQRQGAIDALQTGDAQVAVLGIMAASTGLTLTASSTVVFVELPWRPGDVEQAEARVWRYGQRNAVTCYFLVALGTIEESMAKMLDAKREVTNAAVGEEHRTIEEDGILEAIMEDILT